MRHLKLFEQFVNDSIGKISKTFRRRTNSGSVNWFTRDEILEIKKASSDIGISKISDSNNSMNLNYFGTVDGIGLKESVHNFFKKGGDLCSEVHLSIKNKEGAIKKQEVEVEIKLRDEKDLVVRIDGANPDPFTEDIKIQEFKLCTEIVFLDCTERIKIEKTPRDYLISQLQQNVFNVDAGVNSDTFKLDFSNPVKELYFVIQRRGKIGNNEFQFVTPFDYDNTSIVQDGKYILYENLDHLILTLDGQDIITRETGSVIFLKAVQAAIHHSKTQLIRRFYSYSFALQPEEWYPTGQVNFSLIKEQILNLSMTSCPDFARQLRVYALSYNILRVAEGFSKTLFTVKY